jgi:hypothetical protein
VDTVALDALQRSIAHWEENVAATRIQDVRIGAGDCRLCVVFRGNSEVQKPSDCIGCPVAEKTGQIYCRLTPYSNALRFFDRAWANRATRGPSVYLTCFKQAAQEELDFLRSLLPTEEKQQ